MPTSSDAASILNLQRTAGNAATTLVIQRMKPRDGNPLKKYSNGFVTRQERREIAREAARLDRRIAQATEVNAKLHGLSPETGDAMGQATNEGSAVGGAANDIANRLSAASGRLSFEDAEERLANLQPRVISLLETNPGRGVAVLITAKRSQTPPQAASPLLAPAPWEFVDATPVAADWMGDEDSTFAMARRGVTTPATGSTGTGRYGTGATAGGVAGRGSLKDSGGVDRDGTEWSHEGIWFPPLATSGPSATSTKLTVSRAADFRQICDASGLDDTSIAAALSDAKRVAGAIVPAPYEFAYAVTLDSVEATVTPQVYDEVYASVKPAALAKLADWRIGLEADIEDLQSRLNKIVAENRGTAAAEDRATVARAIGLGTFAIDPHLLDTPRFHVSKAKADTDGGRIADALRDIATACDVLYGIGERRGCADLIASQEH
jgi:hypothetical protein